MTESSNEIEFSFTASPSIRGLRLGELVAQKAREHARESGAIGHDDVFVVGSMDENSSTRRHRVRMTLIWPNSD